MPLEVMVYTMRELWGDGTCDLDTKMKACAIAEKAAPYLHHRLSAVELKADVVGLIAAASEEEIELEYQRLQAELESEKVLPSPALQLPTPAGGSLDG